MANTVQTYINQARFDAYIDADQIDNDICLQFFNEGYHELENAIAVKIRENFFRNDDVLLQNLVS